MQFSLRRNDKIKEKMGVQNFFNDYMNEYFHNLILRPPLFYNWEIGIWFEFECLNYLFVEFLIEQTKQVSSTRRLILMPVHEFGIIDNIVNVKSEIDYDPLKYKCISVDDEIIDTLHDQLSIVRTYFHSLDRPEYGLAYWGITVIPIESLSLFYDVVTSSPLYKKLDELNELAEKIKQAKEEKKYMIHFGV
jgi:hypothetical protein